MGWKADTQGTSLRGVIFWVFSKKNLAVCPRAGTIETSRAANFEICTYWIWAAGPEARLVDQPRGPELEYPIIVVNKQNQGSESNTVVVVL